MALLKIQEKFFNALESAFPIISFFLAETFPTHSRSKIVLVSIGHEHV